MVLENATASDPSFPTDTLPTNDLDPYADTNPPYSPTREPSFVLVSPQPNPLYINLNELPRRLSLFGQKSHPPALINGIKDSCRFATTVLQRPVTQDEANAFAFHFAKSVRIGSYGTPIGVVLGTAFAVRSQNSYGFPFWSPFGKDGKSGRFSPDIFGPLKGQSAKAMWHTLRLGAYWIVGATACQIFFGSYAISVSLAGRAMDPRLKEFTEALKKRMRDGHGREAVRREMEEGSGPKGGSETYDMARQRRNAQEWGKRNRQRNEGISTADDASPTGGAFSVECSDMGAADSFLRDQQAQPETSTQPAESYQPSHQREDQTSRPQPKSRQPASAWDRLRAEAMSRDSSKSPARTSSTPSSSGSSGSPNDAFNFSSEYQDDHLAKAEAQKQFNARIEREREGKDFDERARRW